VLFDTETAAQVKVMKPADNFSGTCWSVCFDPSGQFIVGAGGGGSGMMWFWKPGEEKSFHHLAPPAVVYDLAFHPDGLRLAAALYDNTVAIYDLGPKLDVAQAK
jgi:WD40 repeat protein